MSGVLFASHLLGKGATAVNFGNRFLVSIDAEAEELVVSGGNADGGCGQSAPVVVVVSRIRLPFKGNVLVGRLAEPGRDSPLLGLVQSRIADQDGVGDTGRTECPLNLVPCLRRFLAVVVEQSMGLDPDVELFERTGGLAVTAGGQ